MGRKKVKSQTIESDTPKKRENIDEKKSPISTLPNNYKLKWDKVKGVNGKIVRFKEGDGEEKLKFLNKKNYRQLYVGVDGNDLYFYYEIIE
ncbi:hypothetical protein N9F18_00920 [bacterium]|jgi:hypothetical protein|nr:hypothetical protein [bacterium]